MVAGDNGKGGGGSALPRSPLPPPVTIDQEYLAAILTELRTLNNKLAARPEPETVQGEQVELTEPVRKSRRKGQ